MVYGRSASLLEDLETRSQIKNGEALVEDIEDEKTQRTEAHHGSAFKAEPLRNEALCKAATYFGSKDCETCCADYGSEKSNGVCDKCLETFCKSSTCAASCSTGQASDCKECKKTDFG